MTCGTEFLRRIAVGLCLALPWLTGCAAFHPMNGVPARYIPEEMRVSRRNGQRTIDLSLLNQPWDGIHRVDGGDVLGIYIGGVLGKIDENPQVQFPQNSDYLPAAGVPVTVREDGTISLPMIGTLSIRGMTTREAEEAIRQAFTNHSKGKEYLSPGRERILVSLQRPRQTRVLVVRQDSRNEPTTNAMAGILNLGTSKRGTGKAVSLPAYRNDVLNALIATDGLPGLDAENAVYIIRRNPNLVGNDPLWAPNANPSALIRQSKKEDTPIFRSQSLDAWDYRAQVPPAASNPYANPNANYRQTPSQTMSSQYGQNTANQQFAADNFSNPQFYGGQQQTFDGNQQTFGARQDFSQGQFNPQRAQGDTNPSDISPIRYQYPPPTGGLNPFAPQFDDGSPASAQTSPTQIAPAPLANSGQTYSIPNAGTQRPSPNSNATVVPPYSGPALPNQGYSIPDSPAQGYDQMPPSGPTTAPQQNDINYYEGTGGLGVADGRRIIRIPIRLGPDEHVDIKKEDIILHDGDIVFIESRDTEVFFTGGLLGGGQYTLPRDFDLDVLQALSIATSRLNAGGATRAVGGVSALNSDVTISPSKLVIIRKLPEGGEIPIKIDLYQARSDLSERIFIQPGDYLYLQYTPLEAIAAFVDRHLLEGALFALFTQNTKL